MFATSTHATPARNSICAGSTINGTASATILKGCLGSRDSKSQSDSRSRFRNRQKSRKISRPPRGARGSRRDVGKVDVEQGEAIGGCSVSISGVRNIISGSAATTATPSTKGARSSTAKASRRRISWDWGPHNSRGKIGHEICFTLVSGGGVWTLSCATPSTLNLRQLKLVEIAHELA